MFDSHCHLHDPRLLAELGAVLGRARAAGVRGFLLAGVEPDGWRDERKIAAEHADVAIAYGVHPQLVDTVDDAEADALVAALGDALDAAKAEPPPGARAIRPVAIGEIGLDGLRERKRSMDRQERAFRAQLDLARAHDLPVLLHVLEAHGRTLELLRRDGVPPRGGVLHSASCNAELVPEYVALGLHLSFAGPVTNPNARKTRAAAAAVPPGRLLAETDAPFQTPPVRRPELCEPAFLVEIVTALAEIRGEPAAEVASRTDANARALFGLGGPAQIRQE